MFEVHSLVNLSPMPENDFRLRGLPAHPPIQGADGSYYGHEWARWRHDTLDVRVDEILRAMSAPVRVLDLGCATGSRAAAFARMGCDVTAVDILDQSPAVAARLSEMDAHTCNPKLGSVDFVQADLRRWRPALGARWTLIHARRVINFMTCEEACELFARLRPCVSREGVLAVSFIATGIADAQAMRAPAPVDGSIRLLPGLLSHDFREIAKALVASGFVLSEAFSDGLCDAGCIAHP